LHGINTKQEKQLRSRKIYQKTLDEEEKWRAIYKIIFPEAQDIPSPCKMPAFIAVKLRLMLL
jgi:hypothetical protein